MNTCMDAVAAGDLYGIRHGGFNVARSTHIDLEATERRPAASAPHPPTPEPWVARADTACRAAYELSAILR